jgi:hypothetical protein
MNFFFPLEANPTNWMFAWSLVPVSILPIRADPRKVETEKIMMVELVWLGELSLARRAETFPDCRPAKSRRVN